MKKTAKAMAAFEALAEAGFSTTRMTRDDVYFQLGKLGYEWDSVVQVWYKPEVAKSDIKRIRIVVEKEELEPEIEFVTNAISQNGGKVIDCTRYLTSKNPKYKDSTKVRAYIEYVR